MPDLSIQNAFLDGMYEVFNIMFTEKVKLYLLDDNNTNIDDIYNESKKKVYKDAVEVVAKVRTSFESGVFEIDDIKISAILTIPTKQLKLLNLPRLTQEELKVFNKGKFEYKGIEYLIEKTVPKTLVADEWQFYDFYCVVNKREKSYD